MICSATGPNVLVRAAGSPTRTGSIRLIGRSGYSIAAASIPKRTHRPCLKQQFELAWKSVIDPFTFMGAAALAGFQQGTDDFAAYGQGAQGYAKRFGAAYTDVVSGTFIGSAILPSLLKQDPRYFYKGTGSPRSRILYALASTVICKGDNKRWQPNYSAILGSFATGGISYLYYPASERDAKGLVVQSSLIRIGEGAFENVLQEFLIRRLTPRLQHHQRDQL